MSTIYFTNQQKRQLVDILKKYPCIIFVANCFEFKFKKLAFEQKQK